MDITSLKIYSFNLTALTLSSFDAIEDGLKILLLVVSIGYTIQKWHEARKK